MAGEHYNSFGVQARGFSKLLTQLSACFAADSVHSSLKTRAEPV